MIGKAPRAPLLKLDKADHFSVSIGYYSSPSYSFSDCMVEIVRTDCKNMDQFLTKHPRVQHITRTAILPHTLLSVVECDPPYKTEQVADWGASFTAWTDEQFQACITPIADVLKLNKFAFAVTLLTFICLSALSLCRA